MKINIYGVGRSGTKAIQMYLAYVLAIEHGNVRINYEPYFWQNRKIKHRNFLGIHCDTKENFFPNKIDDLTLFHKNFISNLTSENIPTVTKFIRGHGRIAQINYLLDPQHTIIVIRDVKGVLNSLEKTGFDLFRIGKYSQFNFFAKQVEGFKNSKLFEKRHASLINKAKSVDRKNALIWYFYNLSLLNYNDAYFLDFKNLDAIEDFAFKNLRTNIPFKNDKKFNGHNIHTDNIFIDNKIELKQESKLSKLSLYLLHRYTNRFLHSSQMIGSINSINEAAIITQKLERAKNNNYSKIEDSFINDLDIEIAEKLNIIIQKQERLLNA